MPFHPVAKELPAPANPALLMGLIGRGLVFGVFGVIAFDLSAVRALKR
jgi:hypothetical protein